MGRRLEVGREKVVDISKLLVDHKAENAHLSRTPVVQLDGALSHLGIIAQFVPSKVEGTITFFCYLNYPIIHVSQIIPQVNFRRIEY